jgi:hypothetical protein
MNTTGAITVGSTALNWVQVFVGTTYTFSHGVTSVANDVRLTSIGANSVVANTTGGTAAPTGTLPYGTSGNSTLLQTGAGGTIGFGVLPPISPQQIYGRQTTGVGAPSAAFTASNATDTTIPLAHAPFTVGHFAAFSDTTGTIVDSGTGSTLAPAFYVSATGNDSNAGTLASPFLTFGKCQTAMQASVTQKTCYIRAGSYSFSAGLTLGYTDAGETWSNYPPDNIQTAHLTETSAFAFFTFGAGADNITITGLDATGFQETNHGSCGSPAAYFINITGIGNGGLMTKNPTFTYNKMTTFDCGINIQDAINPVVSYNYFSTMSYAMVGCAHCLGIPTRTYWQGNVFYNMNPGGTPGDNAYMISVSNNSFGSSENFQMQNNHAYYNATWQCYDNHGGRNVAYVNNLCMYMGGNAGINIGGIDTSSSPFHAPSPLVDPLAVGNVIDAGSNSTPIDSIVMCGTGSSCTVAQDIVGGLVRDNFMLLGTGLGCILVTAPTVTVANNNNATPCVSGSGKAPEQVSSITYAGGGTTAHFVASQPNAVVATLAVAMSDIYWTFPTPPGVLTIGGTNSGGFVICNNNQICQPGGGTIAGTYNDFTVQASLTGMKSSPFTATAGTLTLISP